MIVVGLTGSIGMGKSTTAEMFRRASVPVHDSDRAVHELYSGPAAQAIENAFPGVVVAGRVDRNILSQVVLANPDALKRLEAIVHPFVSAHRDAFLKAARAAGAPVVVLDVPLLFETGAEAGLDAVIVVSAPYGVQKQRVLARPGMTVEKFQAIMSRQIPDVEKRRRADFVIDTSRGLEPVEHDVRTILQVLRDRSSAR